MKNGDPKKYCPGLSIVNMFNKFLVYYSRSTYDFQPKL